MSWKHKTLNLENSDRYRSESLVEVNVIGSQALMVKQKTFNLENSDRYRSGPLVGRNCFALDAELVAAPDF